MSPYGEKFMITPFPWTSLMNYSRKFKNDYSQMHTYRG